MSPEERQLISGLFERMRSFGMPVKDREADALITQSVRSNPDAPYMLVQSVLVQEQALQATNARVQELEEQLRALQGDQQRQAGSGGFLGGFWGGRGDEAQPRSSVPAIGSRAAPPVYDGGRQSAWSSQPPPDAQPPPPASGGGGFMKTAFATAAGVAGGMLVADSVRRMLGGSHGHGNSSPETEDVEYLDAPPEKDHGGVRDVDDDPGFGGGGSDEIDI
jgi:hypothetical protein